MGHGEAEHGCAQGEPCRPGHHEQVPSAKHPRRLSGVPHQGEPTAGRGTDRVDDDPPAPRQRGPEPDELDPPEPAPAQRSSVPSLRARSASMIAYPWSSPCSRTASSSASR
ncbi:hypothetical protein, partial [Micromonospora sp. ATA51]|uniref:hypothetical protein n=1 Tax=Micromonospora sp. ATA51 TaxID=2806098 RepID=UPI001A58E3DC